MKKNEYNIESVMTFGGEPLLYPDTVYEIHKAATEINIPKRQLITNGYFSRDYGTIEIVAQKPKLKRASLNKEAI